MDDIRRIRRRISRKSRQRSPHRLSRWFTKGVIAVMGLCVGGLSFMIALRLQIPQAQQAMDYFTSLNWSDYLPFDTWFRQDEVQSVASMGQYEAVGEHRYHNGTNEATAVCEGIIVHIEAQNETYCVTMKSDDGVMINFANLQEAAVQEDERIRSGAALGTYQEYVEIRCFRDGEEIALEDMSEGRSACCCGRR